MINLRGIADLPDAPDYAALRSYATGRREHPLLGPMPPAVARIANRRLWLKDDVAAWLHCPIPKWRRTRSAIARWIEQGRPRPQAAHTLVGDDGRSTPAP